MRFKQTEVMPRSTLAICFLQDRVSVQRAGKQHHVKPFGSWYQLLTRAGGRRKAGFKSCDQNLPLLFASGSPGVLFLAIQNLFSEFELEVAEA